MAQYYHIDMDETGEETLRFSYQKEELRDYMAEVMEQVAEDDAEVTTTESDELVEMDMLRGLAFATDVVEALEDAE